MRPVVGREVCVAEARDEQLGDHGVAHVLRQDVHTVPVAVEKQADGLCKRRVGADATRDVVGERIDEVPRPASGLLAHIVVHDQASYRIDAAVEQHVVRELAGAVFASEVEAEALARRQDPRQAAVNTETDAARETQLAVLVVRDARPSLPVATPRLDVRDDAALRVRQIALVDRDREQRQLSRHLSGWRHP